MGDGKRTRQRGTRAGVSLVRFLDHDDDIALPERETINQIAAVIGEVRLDVFVTH